MPSSFFVYKCIKCRRVLDRPGALCDDCLIALKKETKIPCSKCGVPHSLCRCRIQRDNSGIVESCAHIAPYLPSGVTHKLVIASKTQRNFALFDFLALALADRVKNAFHSPDVIINIPRSFIRRRKFGFDQTQEVAKRISDILGIAYLPALKRKGFLMQKSLDFIRRQKNAERAFCLDEEYAASLAGKRVILYDDLVTSGASARACVKLLKEAGVSCIFFLSFAKTEKLR